nr:hypothetical protein CFP56_61964 [Quercus suber]
MLKKTLFNVARVVILAFLIFTIKPLVATRPLDDKKASNAAKKMSYQENRAATPPSGPNSCTYIPGSPGNGHCP